MQDISVLEKASPQLLKIIEQGFGYRNDNISFFQDRQAYALEILDFECKELGNTDIQSTMYEFGYINKSRYNDAKRFLKELELVMDTKLYGIWLCASMEEIKASYPDDYNTHNIDKVSKYRIDYQDQYYTVLPIADLDVEGILFIQATPFQLIESESFIN